MSLEKFIASIDDVEAKLTKMKEEARALAQKEFEYASQELFRLIPRLKALIWSQYSPYFNDGDECVFGVNSVSAMSFIPEDFDFQIPEDEEEQNHFIISDYDDENRESLSELEIRAINAMSNFIETNEELMEDLFGNHVYVILTADGADVQECSHD